MIPFHGGTHAKARWSRSMDAKYYTGHEKNTAQVSMLFVKFL